jgi:hypothetical protein
MTTSADTPPAGPPANQTTGSPSIAPAGAATHPKPDDGLDARMADVRKAERAALLKSLGFESEAAAKRALEDAKKAELEKLSEAERLAAKIKELEPAAARAALLEERLKAQAEARLAALPEKAREIITRRAGDDVEKRLELIELLAESGALAGATQPAQAQAQPAAQPISTSAPAGAPKPATPPTAYEQWQQRIKDHGAMGADLFYAANRKAIDDSRPS